jgi:hypothetical protein
MIEILGFPEDHLKEVVKQVVEKLKNENGIAVIQSEVHEPQVIQEKFFSSFIEAEIKINDFNKLLHFCYEYLPSTIELLDVEKVTITNREFTIGINEMLQKIHNYNIIINNISNRLQKLEKTDQ